MVVQFGQGSPGGPHEFSIAYVWHGACIPGRGGLKTMKKTLLALTLGAGSLLGADFYFGVGVNVGPGGYVLAPPPPPPVVVTYMPPRPAVGYVWVPGYWYPAGRAYRWRGGYWAKPPRGKVRWVAPQYRGGRYYVGYWR
jgi:hypothetical protein